MFGTALSKPLALVMYSGRESFARLSGFFRQEQKRGNGKDQFGPVRTKPNTALTWWQRFKYLALMIFGNFAMHCWKPSSALDGQATFRALGNWKGKQKKRSA